MEKLEGGRGGQKKWPRLSLAQTYWTYPGKLWANQHFFSFFFGQRNTVKTQKTTSSKCSQSLLTHHFKITLSCLSWFLSWFPRSSWDVDVWYGTQRLPWCLLFCSLHTVKWKLAFSWHIKPPSPPPTPRSPLSHIFIACLSLLSIKEGHRGKADKSPLTIYLTITFAWYLFFYPCAKR